jgi:hypothetical protein
MRNTTVAGSENPVRVNTTLSVIEVASFTTPDFAGTAHTSNDYERRKKQRVMSNGEVDCLREGTCGPKHRLPSPTPRGCEEEGVNTRKNTRMCQILFESEFDFMYFMNSSSDDTSSSN